MKELSLNIRDIAENSVKAGAALVQILLTQRQDTLTITIADNGCGMTPEVLRSVTDPFYTTRTTRKVGLGLPLLKLAAEQTGGSVRLTSRPAGEDPENHGTEVTALFHTNHIDCPPMGDVSATLMTLIQGHPETDFLYRHERPGKPVELDTRRLREVLGSDVPLNSFEVLQWIEEYLREQYQTDQTNQENREETET